MSTSDGIPQDVKSRITRRHFFQRCNTGLGAVALVALALATAGGLDASQQVDRSGHTTAVRGEG